MLNALPFPDMVAVSCGKGAGDASGAAQKREASLRIGQLAVRSLHMELTLYPKPGLVSPVDSGSHEDMDAHTFMRSLFALRGYFVRMAQAGMAGAPFERLRRHGLEAECRMLAATGGVNTHRGAIFSLGLLCAAAGRCHANNARATGDAIRLFLLDAWGEALTAHLQEAATLKTGDTPGLTHGLRAAVEHGAGGARQQAARGFPAVFEVALPRLRQTLARGGTMREACIDALFALMAQVADTNVLHRGGGQGAALVKRQARRFLAQGGTAHAQWQQTALDCHRIFMRHRLSPGGAADLLAAAWFVHRATQPA